MVRCGISLVPVGSAAVRSSGVLDPAPACDRRFSGILVGRLAPEAARIGHGVAGAALGAGFARRPRSPAFVFSRSR